MVDDDGTGFDVKQFHNWTARNPSGYTGVYHFGESEGEVEMLVIGYDSGLVVQAFRGDWGKVDGQKGDVWRKTAEVFRNLKLTGNKFVSGYEVGMFMTYKGDSTLLWGGRPGSTNTDTMECGTVVQWNLRKFWFFQEGDYPELSLKIQGDDYFKDRTKEQLQLMRNEIYARYGQRFVKGGAMHAWFSKKEWYQPFRDNVQDCLTAIELRNIAAIKKYETIDK